MRSFTLVELLVAVSILAIGVVGVLRSFLGAVSVLDHVNNRLAAVLFLDEKAGIFVLEASLPKEDVVREGEENIRIKDRDAIYRFQRMPLNDVPYEGLDSLSLSVTWKEGNKVKDETMVLVEQGKT